MGPTANATGHVSPNGCYRGGCKQYYMDIAAPGRTKVLGYECTIPHGGRAPGKGCEPLEVGNGLKMVDELLVVGVSSNYMSSQSRWLLP